MKCPYCKEEIIDGSIRCKHCQVELSTDEAKNMLKEENKMSPLVKWGGLFILFTALIGVMAGGGQVSTNTSQTGNIVIPKDVPNTWEYSTREDKLSGKSIYTARIVANEKLYFDFPYAGGQDATLILRHNGPNDNDVMLTVSKGQFVGSYNSSIKVRFDEGKVETIGFNEPSDYSSDTIFIKGETAFIEKIKKAKKLVIEASFYNEGNHAMVFNVEGVKY